MGIFAIQGLAIRGPRRNSSFLCGLGCILLVILLTAPLSGNPNGRYSFRILDQSYGLSDLVVRDLLQDRAGFLWVATHTGLYRYDGRSFRRFGTADGLASDWITNLAEGPDGTLWVATTQGLCRRTAEGFQTLLPASDGLRFSPARGSPLAVGPEGDVYLSLAAGLFEITVNAPEGSRPGQPSAFAPPARVRLLHPIPPSSAAPVAPIAISETGHLCMALSGEALLQCMEPFSGRVILRRNIPAGRHWTSLVPLRDGDWAAATANGEVFQLPAGGSAPLLLAIPYPGSGHLRLLGDGSLLTPAEDGFSVYRHGALTHIHQPDGFPPDRAESFLEDREGNVWVGTVGSGLLQWLGPNEWRSWDASNGLPGPSVSQLAPDAGGALWVGTNRGLAVGKPKSAGFRAVTPPGAASDRAPIFGLTVGQAGDIWFSNERGVLRRWQPDTRQVQEFSSRNGVSLDIVCELLWHSGALWIADTLGLARLRQVGDTWEFERLFPHPGQDPRIVYSLTAGHGEQILAATASGLMILDGRNTEWITSAQGLLHDNVFGVVLGNQGSLWVHYRHPLGITEILGERGARTMRHHRREHGLASDKVFSLLAGRHGRLWAGTESGLSVLQDGTWLNFTRDNGLNWNDCSIHSLYEDPQGALWIGTARGLSRFQPPHHLKVPHLAVSILGLQTDGGPFVDAHSLSGGHAPSEFQISFAAPRFTNQDLITFRYRLGEAAQWLESSDNQLHFARVEPGRHEFQVQARLGASPWSPPASLRLHVPTPWWRQWWALALALWCLAALARAVWRWRYRLVLKRQAELESAVTERTRQLEEQREKAEAANEFKNHILANVSHEMRTPLNGILGFTDLMLNTELNDEQRAHLQTVQASGRSLVDIIEDLLDFSAFESGDVVLRTVNCQLAGILQDASRSVQGELQRKGLHFTLQLSPDLPHQVATDEQRLRQILLNLLSNAVKFTDHGSITLEAALAAAGEVSRLAGPQPQNAASLDTNPPVWVSLRVKDEGIGIPPGQLAVIFEPFRQLDGTRRRRHGGAGLGLAIVKRLVDAFGGFVSVTSHPGVGSEFTVVLPVGHVAAGQPGTATGGSPRPQSCSAPAPAQDPIPAELRKVLIAEDNPVNQTLLARILKTRGLHVVAVANGQAAVDAVEREHFDLVLMDIQMPVMDGIEATRRIRRQETVTGRRIPIIAVTANGLFQCRQECLDVGMDGYVVKPFGPGNLFDAIEQVTRQCTATPTNPPVTPAPEANSPGGSAYPAR